MYDIKEETSLEVLKECLTLGKDQYYEIEQKSKHIEYEGNFGLLKPAMPFMSIVTARLDGVMIGYFVNLVTPDFLTASLVGKEVAIYVAPSHRGQKLLEKLLELTETIAISKGAKQQLLSFKKGRNEGLGLKLGYEPSEIVYEKYLGK